MNIHQTFDARLDETKSGSEKGRVSQLEHTNCHPEQVLIQLRILRTTEFPSQTSKKGKHNIYAHRAQSATSYCESGCPAHLPPLTSSNRGTSRARQSTTASIKSTSLSARTSVSSRMESVLVMRMVGAV